MCGLAGFVDQNNRLRQPEFVLAAMTATLAHRGPDGQGIWFDAGAGVGLGHRRLSIIDLSEEGRQPMISAGGRYVISFNGEVYNFAELRREVEGRGWRFRGHSDTEVMLAAIEAWGLEAAVSRFVGMFAFALWDRKARVLHLVRDRLGIKPLYYANFNGSLVFASELKAFREYPGIDLTIDRNAIALLLRHSYIPAPYSIYEGIRKLLPAHILSMDYSQVARGEADLRAYWSAAEIAERGARDEFGGSPDEARDELDRLLKEAIGLRMIADVPLGAFLSGGIDSSTVVALMQAQSRQPVKTFSIGFHERGYNEAEHARAVAAHLGTEHHELYVSSNEAMAVIPELPTLFDEPFADPSQIPTFLVSKMARRHVTVCLSGDGGDELFYGYNRYAFSQRVWDKISLLPAPVRRQAGRLLALGAGGASRVQALSEYLSVDGFDDLYRRVHSHWKSPASVVVEADELPAPWGEMGAAVRLSDATRRMMFFDLVSYLPDDILAKVDRASMAVGLEARVPLLDHRVVEFAWRLPTTLKMKAGQGKWILRQVLYKYVAPDLVERPKMGFGIPIDQWLRGPLRAWAEELLDEHRLRWEGYFNPAPIRQKWQEHLAGTHDWHYYLWDVLMFEAWHDAQ